MVAGTRTPGLSHRLCTRSRSRYDALADVENVGDFTEPDPEAIAAEEPDLIVRSIETDEDLDCYLTSDILLIPAGPDGASAPDNDVLTGSPLWPTLTAVGDERVFPILTGRRTRTPQTSSTPLSRRTAPSTTGGKRPLLS